MVGLLHRTQIKQEDALVSAESFQGGPSDPSRVYVMGCMLYVSDNLLCRHQHLQLIPVTVMSHRPPLFRVTPL
jgi:hypothetical protein